jgi:hypothetical protein
MKNEHLIPVSILDLVDKFNNSKNENEKINYQLRIEAVRDYCDQAVKKHLADKSVKKSNTRVVR